MQQNKVTTNEDVLETDTHTHTHRRSVHINWQIAISLSLSFSHAYRTHKNTTDKMRPYHI